METYWNNSASEPAEPDNRKSGQGIMSHNYHSIVTSYDIMAQESSNSERGPAEENIDLKEGPAQLINTKAMAFSSHTERRSEPPIDLKNESMASERSARSERWLRSEYLESNSKPVGTIPTCIRGCSPGGRLQASGRKGANGH
jgi:hypothetical protein